MISCFVVLFVGFSCSLSCEFVLISSVCGFVVRLRWLAAGNVREIEICDLKGDPFMGLCSNDFIIPCSSLFLFRFHRSQTESMHLSLILKCECMLQFIFLHCSFHFLSRKDTFPL